jgi:hypothetical protein
VTLHSPIIREDIVGGGGVACDALPVAAWRQVEGTFPDGESRWCGYRGKQRGRERMRRRGGEKDGEVGAYRN